METMHSLINIMKSYCLMIKYAFFLCYVCVFLDLQGRVNMIHCKRLQMHRPVLCGELMPLCQALGLVASDRKKEIQIYTHVILIIYSHKFSILFKMSTVHCKEII